MSNRRYMVHCKSGRKFMVEEYGEPYTSWGNVNPSTKQLEKVGSKLDEPIGEHNTQIKTENGFKNIVMLNAGTSPLAYIEALDSSGIERFEKINFGTYL